MAECAPQPRNREDTTLSVGDAVRLSAAGCAAGEGYGEVATIVRFAGKFAVVKGPRGDTAAYEPRHLEAEPHEQASETACDAPPAEEGADGTAACEGG
eukprot:gene12968-1790_t